MKRNLLNESGIIKNRKFICLFSTLIIIPALFFMGEVSMVDSWNYELQPALAAEHPKGSGNLDTVPSPPLNVKAGDGEITDAFQYILIHWDDSQGATYYEVYRATSINGVKTKVGCPSINPWYHDYSALPEFKYYYYWVKACNSSGCSGFSDYDTGWRQDLSRSDLPPTNLVASDGTYEDEVYVTWDSVSGTERYILKRAKSYCDNRVGISCVDTLTHCSDTWAEPGIEYHYWVQACTTTFTTRCTGLSESDTGYRGEIIPTEPTITEPSPTEPTVTEPSPTEPTVTEPSPTQIPTFRLNGIVYDASNLTSLEGVQIRINGPYTGSTTTDEDGWFMFDNLPQGIYSFEASKIGYDKGTTVIRLDEDTTINPLLEPTSEYKPLAVYYSPTWYQDVDATDPDADYITRFDFDQNWNGADNWQNQDAGIALNAYIYYTVVESNSHWFITYADYHPRDWGGLNNENNYECTGNSVDLPFESILYCHENDMEGIILVVRKPSDETTESNPFGEIELMATLFHTGFEFYENDGTIKFQEYNDGMHPVLYIEPKGHGVKAYSSALDFVGNGEIRYVYEANNPAEPPNPFEENVTQLVTYDLIHLNDNLWPRRLDFLVSPDKFKTFEFWGKFDQEELSASPIGAFAPWLWKELEIDKPEVILYSLFRDPANYVPMIFPNIEDFSTAYLYNPYLGTDVIITALYGGVLVSNDGTVEVRIPQGANNVPLVMNHSPLTSSDTANSNKYLGFSHKILDNIPTPDGLVSLGNGFKVNAKNLDTGELVTEFQKQYEIIFHYTDDEIDEISESSLMIYMWDGLDWYPEQSSLVDEENNQITASFHSPGIFVIFGVPDKRIYLPQIGNIFSPPLQQEMIFIPAGEFQMGCEESTSYCYLDNNLPLHSVNIDDYYIDKYEVSNFQYNQCVRAGVCNPPENSSSHTRLSYFNNSTYFNYPVIYVTWDDAVRYCTWQNKRLPTEAEWEKAARGTIDARRYPWGYEYANCTFANYYDESNNIMCVGDTSLIGSHPEGKSPYGVMGMAGNAWEWVSDWFQEDYYSTYPIDGWPNNPLGPSSGTEKVLRGGSFYFNAVYVFMRYHRPSNSKTYDFGFRCAASP